MQSAWFALSFAVCNAGRRNPASMPMMVMTTSSSISVKALDCLIRKAPSSFGVPGSACRPVTLTLGISVTVCWPKLRNLPPVQKSIRSSCSGPDVRKSVSTGLPRLVDRPFSLDYLIIRFFRASVHPGNPGHCWEGPGAASPLVIVTPARARSYGGLPQLTTQYSCPIRTLRTRASSVPFGRFRVHSASEWGFPSGKL